MFDNSLDLEKKFSKLRDVDMKYVMILMKNGLIGVKI